MVGIKNEQAKQEERSRKIVQVERKEPWWKPDAKHET